MSDRTCPRCLCANEGAEAFCGACWSAVPMKHRAAIRRAQKAVGYNPASPRVQQDLKDAIAAALRATR